MDIVKSIRIIVYNARHCRHQQQYLSLRKCNALMITAQKLESATCSALASFCLHINATQSNTQPALECCIIIGTRLNIEVGYSHAGGYVGCLHDVRL